jgi:AraC family transcriptional regulator
VPSPERKNRHVVRLTAQPYSITVSAQPSAPRRDRLRELLDAVVDTDNVDAADMARSSFASEFHFSRRVSRLTGEPPAALRRRVMLERAA